MKINIPAKVKAGDILSAQWMNATSEAIKRLSELSARRRILSGTGYSIKESSGGTSLSIDRQSQFLRQEDEFPFFSNIDFTVRLKPKDLSAEDLQGNWKKVIQVHKGYVLNHLGESIRVENFEGSEPPPLGEGVATWDAENWVDVPVNSGEKSFEILVKVNLDASGNPASAYFCTEEKADDFIYVPIALLEIEAFASTGDGGAAETKFYLTQYHLGSIEIGGATDVSSMPFDAKVSLVGDECAEGSEPEPCVQVNGGRVFLAEGKHAVIPPKGGSPFDLENALKAADGYLLLELTMTASGTLEYQYRIDSELPTTAIPVSERQ